MPFNKKRDITMTNLLVWLGAVFQDQWSRFSQLKSGTVFIVYFCLLVILTSRSIISYMTGLHSYQLADWGINYAGGFVRRGLVGEILLSVSQATGWSFMPIATSVSVFLTLVFLYFAARLFYPLRENHWAWLLIYAPFGIVAPVLHQNLAGHKEPFLFLLAAVLFFVSATWSTGKRKEIMIYFLLLLTAPLLLVHEAYIIYMPLLFAALTVLPLSPRVFVIGTLIGLLDIFVFVVSAGHAGDFAQRDAMMLAYYAQLPVEWSMRPLDEVAFFFIGQDFKEALLFSLDRNILSIPQLPAALVMTVGPLVFFTWKIGFKCIFDDWSWSGRIVLLLFVIALVAQLAILPVIIDWTRFLSIFLVIGSMAVVMRLWVSRCAWAEIPGVLRADNAAKRYTLGWTILAALILLKPGKVTPDVIRFDANDVLGDIVIAVAIYVGFARAARFRTSKDEA